jgi:hypothetical protein
MVFATGVLRGMQLHMCCANSSANSTQHPVVYRSVAVYTLHEATYPRQAA